MASYKSQYNPPPRPDPRTPSTQRTTSSTRLPTRSVTPTAQRTVTPTTTKLQKKRVTKDEAPPSTRSLSHQRGTVANTTRETPRHPSSRQAPQSSQSNNAGMTLPVPRYATQTSTSSARFSKYDTALANTRTPSLVSGSSASTIESPKSMLRRKPSSIGRQIPTARPDSMSSFEEDEPIERRVPGTYNDPFAEAVFGITLPSSAAMLASKELERDLIDRHPIHFAGPPILATDIFPPPTPQYALSSTPSTRYSESPNSFSHMSTPTSMSSHSPGITLSHKPGPKLRQASPLYNSRPPVTRRNVDDLLESRERRALSAVRESTTSSSSASTVRVMDTIKQRELMRDPLPAPPPSPPFSNMPSLAQPREYPAHTMYSPPVSPRQIPPEFAHLADPVQDTLPSNKPARPSRDGTVDITALRQQSPIIHSNMSSLPQSHHRRQSSGASRLGMSGSQNGSATRITMPSKIPSRNPSPNPNVNAAFSPRSTSRAASSRVTTPDMASDAEKKASKGKSSTAPSPSKAPSRFGFFRRTKTEPAAAPPKQEKKLRKGPAAGTGHEGYGKFAMRGRSGSTNSATGSVGRSSSADSVDAAAERTPSSRKGSVASQVDDYFLDRLAPVVIRGNGSSTEICRSPERLQSSSSLESTLDSVGPDPRRKAVNASPSNDVVITRPTLLPSAMPDSSRGTSPMRRFGLGIRRGSESEEEKKSGFMPTLANRRSSRRSQIFSSKDNGKIPTPLNAPRNTSTDTLSSLSRQISGPKASDKASASKKAPLAAKPKKSEEQPKPTRKWNFFQRTQASEAKKATFAERQESRPKQPPSRSVAHYALDTVDNQTDVDELGTIMKEADIMSKEPIKKQTLAPPKQTLPRLKNRPIPGHVHSVLLPSPPVLPPSFSQSPRAASPQVTLRKEHNVGVTSPSSRSLLSSPEPEFTFVPEPTLDQLPRVESKPAERVLPKPKPIERAPVAPVEPPTALPQPRPRPSRLPQVGRIPQVVSQRERERKLSDSSFSRPFMPTQPRPSVYMPRTSAESVSAPVLAEEKIIVEAYPAFSALSSPFSQTSFNMGDFNTDNGEFLVFPPRRKDSEMSSGSSGFFSFHAPTAIVPLPNSPPCEDEVWDEYDDLIDEVLSPQILSPQRLSETGSLHSARVNSSGSPVQERKNGRRIPAPIKTTHSASNSTSSNPGTMSVHLRRSRLLSALNTASPKSAMSISDFVSSYGDRHPSVSDSGAGRFSSSSGHARSASSTIPTSVADGTRASRSTTASDLSKRTSSKYRDTKLMEMAGASADTKVSMADLRFGALMTSKWLTFGRVLFSPVHFDLKDPAEDRILVVDGLGKDWSYYSALTYSEATVYNLGPSPESAPSSTGPAPWSTLPNHRHIHHPSTEAPFPFPRGFFAAVVYRFPLVTSESLFKFAISECKRVLRPGGYLETSVLDIELLNMGNRTRRAVRGLKVQMQVADPSVCLKPASDMVMKMLGKKGFENINRCLVGVPVSAGRLDSWGSDSSAEESADPKARSKSNGRGKSSTARDKGKAKAKPTKATAPPPTFTDLLTTPPSPDPAVAATADANISDMVARVGRWWYSKCYESTLIPDADEQSKTSIWADGKLLRECEKRGTGFRLLVAYAQKPNCTVRRTVSV